MIRLFVGLPLSEAVRERLAGLAFSLPRARWVARENLHLTLRFIGEVGDTAAADIDDELARIAAPSFDLTIDGIGHFDSRGCVRTLWAGVARCEPLRALHGKIEQALRHAGQPPEGRRFSPHVTLARLREVPLAMVEPFVASHATLRFAPMRVVHFVLYSSALGHAGPVYTAERDYPLRDDDYAELAAEWEAGEGRPYP